MKTTEKAIQAWLALPKYSLDCDYVLRVADPEDEPIVLMGPDAIQQIADDLRELARLREDVMRLALKMNKAAGHRGLSHLNDWAGLFRDLLGDES